MNTNTWYAQLRKPKWAPPSWLFGPVWTVLYLIIAVTFGTIFYQAALGKLAFMIALPFVLNLIVNVAFTPIQFGLKNNFLASVDILFILGTLIWGLLNVWNSSLDLHWIVYANIPYLAWVSFATVLQLTITFLNNSQRDH
jgi:benzodiazapine receptor